MDASGSLAGMLCGSPPVGSAALQHGHLCMHPHPSQAAHCPADVTLSCTSGPGTGNGSPGAIQGELFVKQSSRGGGAGTAFAAASALASTLSCAKAARGADMSLPARKQVDELQDQQTGHEKGRFEPRKEGGCLSGMEGGVASSKEARPPVPGFRRVRSGLSRVLEASVQASAAAVASTEVVEGSPRTVRVPGDADRALLEANLEDLPGLNSDLQGCQHSVSAAVLYPEHLGDTPIGVFPRRDQRSESISILLRGRLSLVTDGVSSLGRSYPLTGSTGLNLVPYTRDKPRGTAGPRALEGLASPVVCSFHISMSVHDAVAPPAVRPGRMRLPQTSPLKYTTARRTQRGGGGGGGVGDDSDDGWDFGDVAFGDGGSGDWPNGGNGGYGGGGGGWRGGDGGGGLNEGSDDSRDKSFDDLLLGLGWYSFASMRRPDSPWWMILFSGGGDSRGDLWLSRHNGVLMLSYRLACWVSLSRCFLHVFLTALSYTPSRSSGRNAAAAAAAVAAAAAIGVSLAPQHQSADITGPCA